jgi:hypothetical protein
LILCINEFLSRRRNNCFLRVILSEVNKSELLSFVAVVESLLEDVLCDENRFDWLSGQPLWEYILDETSGEHYQEHLGALLIGVDHFKAE